MEPSMTMTQETWARENPTKKIIGSRAQVMHGNAFKTKGQLRKQDLMYHPSTGRIVSVRKRRIGLRAFQNMTSKQREQFQEQQEKVSRKAKAKAKAQSQAKSVRIKNEYITAPISKKPLKEKLKRYIIRASSSAPPLA